MLSALLSLGISFLIISLNFGFFDCLYEHIRSQGQVQGGQCFGVVSCFDTGVSGFSKSFECVN